MYLGPDGIETIYPKLRFSDLTAVGDRLYFSSYSSTGPEGDPLGAEVWTSDGTANGTYRLLDLAPGTASASPTYITSFNGEVALVSGGNLYLLDPDAVQLKAPLNQSINEGSTVSFVAETKGRGVTFSLGSGAPAGATIDPVTGLFVWTASDNYAQPVTISIIATGRSGATDTKSFTVNVAGVAPNITLAAAPGAALRGEIVAFSLAVNDPSSADMAAGFTYLIDWDGDGVQDHTLSGSAGLVVSHAFTQPGTQTLHFLAIDKDGIASSVLTRTITIDAWRTVADASNPSLTDLIWSGTPGQDRFAFAYTGLNQITVTTTATQVFNGITGRLIAYGQGGDDVLDASSISGHSVELRGNAGNDTIIGSDGSDLLYGDSDGGEGGKDSITAGNGDDIVYADGSEGYSDTVSGGLGNDQIFGDPFQGGEGAADSIDTGDGNDFVDAGLGTDIVNGGAGNDVLIGGKDADSITGGAGQDLIISSGLAISFYASAGAGLQQVWSQWRTSDSIADPIAYLSGTPGGVIDPSTILAPGSAVIDDDAVVTIDAHDDAEMDWILADASEDIVQDAIDDYSTDL